MSTEICRWCHKPVYDEERHHGYSCVPDPAPVMNYRLAFKRAYQTIRLFKGAVPDELHCQMRLDDRTMLWLAGACYLEREPKLLARRAYLGLYPRPNLPA